MSPKGECRSAEHESTLMIGLSRIAVTLALTGALSAHAQVTAPASSPPASPAKKELVQKLLLQQQPAVERLARSLAEEPAARLMQQAGAALQTHVPPDKREAAAKKIEADVRKYVDEAVPLVRERAIKLMPSTIGTALEEKFTEDELRQLLGWLESPVNKKYQQMAPELQDTLVKKLVADARPAIDTQLKALEANVIKALGVPVPGASAPAPSTTKPVSGPRPGSASSGPTKP